MMIYRFDDDGNVIGKIKNGDIERLNYPNMIESETDYDVTEIRVDRESEEIVKEPNP